MRCPSTSSMDLAYGALPLAATPPARRERCHGVARVVYPISTLPVFRAYRAGDGVPSVATGMVLLAVKSKDDPDHGARVALLVDTLYSRFGELQGKGRHPKWREINLAAGLPGWTWTPEAWLNQHPGERAQPVTAKPNIEAGDGSAPSPTRRPRSKGGIVQTVHRMAAR